MARSKPMSILGRAKREFTTAAKQCGEAEMMTRPEDAALSLCASLENANRARSTIIKQLRGLQERGIEVPKHVFDPPVEKLVEPALLPEKTKGLDRGAEKTVEREIEREQQMKMEIAQ